MVPECDPYPYHKILGKYKNQNFIRNDINAPDPLHQEHSLLNGQNWEAIHSKRRHRAAIIAANGGHTHYRDAINEFSANFSHFDFFSPLPKNVTFWGWGTFLGSTPVLNNGLNLFLLFFGSLYANNEILTI